MSLQGTVLRNAISLVQSDPSALSVTLEVADLQQNTVISLSTPI